jgi:hypothetical protein
MSPDQLFSLLNLIALMGWLMLALLPGKRWVADAVTGYWIPALLAVTYIVIIAVNWSSSSGGFSSLPDVAQLFSNPWLLLAGWTHYLAFDLFIGSWEMREGRQRGIPHLLMLPCLALTFLFGPAGWLLFVGIRARYSR